ncbi:MAG: twin-arginine translocase TatA/TatE family subunit [Flavobacteriia bacterium]|jgi:sec-independent protein translocase protein TatA
MMLLFLNDVSGTEILVILIFILMFFGSKSIPGIARSMGRTIRQIKDASNDLQDEIRKSGVDMKNDLNLSNIIQETTREIQQPLDQYADDLNNSIRFESPKNAYIPPAALPLDDQNTVDADNDVESLKSSHLSDNADSEQQKG